MFRIADRARADWYSPVATLALAAAIAIVVAVLLFGRTANAAPLCNNDGRCFGTTQADQGGGHHSRRHAVDSNSNRVARRSLAGSINAKLARWVHPTGKCSAGETERLATYYNSGRRTATGERFNRHGMTAAHRTLPFGTQLSITNPATGQSVSVTINDRGPFTHAWIDLAQGAAFAIGMRKSIYVCVSGASFAQARP